MNTHYNTPADVSLALSRLTITNPNIAFKASLPGGLLYHYDPASVNEAKLYYGNDLVAPHRLILIKEVSAPDAITGTHRLNQVQGSAIWAAAIRSNLMRAIGFETVKGGYLAVRLVDDVWFRFGRGHGMISRGDDVLEFVKAEDVLQAAKELSKLFERQDVALKHWRPILNEIKAEVDAVQPHRVNTPALLLYSKERVCTRVARTKTAWASGNGREFLRKATAAFGMSDSIVEDTHRLLSRQFHHIAHTLIFDARMRLDFKQDEHPSINWPLLFGFRIVSSDGRFSLLYKDRVIYDNDLLNLNPWDMRDLFDPIRAEESLLSWIND